MYLKSAYIHSTCHAYIKLSSVVPAAAGLGALLHIFSVTPLLEGLPGHVLLDVLALLPGGGGAFPAGGAGAVLLVNILGDGGGDIAADLVRDVITHLTGCGDIVAHLAHVRKELDREIKDGLLPAWGPGCTACW